MGKRNIQEIEEGIKDYLSQDEFREDRYGKSERNGELKEDEERMNRLLSKNTPKECHECRRYQTSDCLLILEPHQCNIVGLRLIVGSHLFREDTLKLEKYTPQKLTLGDLIKHKGAIA